MVGSVGLSGAEILKKISITELPSSFDQKIGDST